MDEKKMYETATDYMGSVTQVWNIAKSILLFTGYWNESNPLERAVDLLREQVEKLTAELQQLNARVNGLPPDYVEIRAHIFGKSGWY